MNMADLLVNAFVTLLISIAAVTVFLAVFSGAMFLYFWSWRRSLKEPGEQS